MSRHGTLLPIPDDPRVRAMIEAGLTLYPNERWPRSIWLHWFEVYLSEHYPQSSSADRKLTARHYAPFPLRDGHDVP